MDTWHASSMATSTRRGVVPSPHANRTVVLRRKPSPVRPHGSPCLYTMTRLETDTRLGGALRTCHGRFTVAQPWNKPSNTGSPSVRFNDPAWLVLSVAPAEAAGGTCMVAMGSACDTSVAMIRSAGMPGEVSHRRHWYTSHTASHTATHTAKYTKPHTPHTTATRNCHTHNCHTQQHTPLAAASDLPHSSGRNSANEAFRAGHSATLNVRGTADSEPPRSCFSPTNAWTHGPVYNPNRASPRPHLI